MVNNIQTTTKTVGAPKLPNRSLCVECGIALSEANEECPRCSLPVSATREMLKRGLVKPDSYMKLTPTTKWQGAVIVALSTILAVGALSLGGGFSGTAGTFAAAAILVWAGVSIASREKVSP